MRNDICLIIPLQGPNRSKNAGDLAKLASDQRIVNKYGAIATNPYYRKISKNKGFGAPPLNPRRSRSYSAVGDLS
jgi:hypothetical protein